MGRNLPNPSSLTTAMDLSLSLHMDHPVSSGAYIADLDEAVVL
jgi:citrate synthase